jgi:DNA invertase Pin-like site-specific DNA recombinase
MTAVGYTRISTEDQSAELQVRALRAYAESHGGDSRSYTRT